MLKQGGILRSKGLRTKTPLPPTPMCLSLCSLWPNFEGFGLCCVCCNSCKFFFAVNACNKKIV